MSTPQKPPTEAPKELDAIADKVLAYRPKPKTKPARSRTRRAKQLRRASHSQEPETA